MESILLKNGKIMDGTGAPWFTADVLVENGIIKEIGLIDKPADIVIDASGKVVAPGFIDAHSHSDMSVDFINDSEGKIIQGVTTEVAGMCGVSPAPLKDFKEEWLVSASVRTLSDGVPWNSFKEWADYINEKGLASDMLLPIGHGTIRCAAMGYADRKPTDAEMETMKQLVREAMEQGALGISSGLIYPPGVFSDTDELIELCKVAAEYGGIYFTHMRNEANELIEALEEAIEIGRKSGCKVQIAHHKAAGKPNHGKVKQTLEMMEAARLEGIDIACDAYPYFAGSSSLVTLIPKWAHEGGVAKLVERLKNSETRAQIENEIMTDIPGWESMAKNAGWEGILICWLPVSKEYEGKNLAEAAEMRNQSEFDALVDILIENDGGGQMACFGSIEEDNLYVYKHRLTMVGSDSSACPLEEDPEIGKPHPRTFGTFPRVLGKYSREYKAFPMETAVHKMTGLTASRLGLKNIGFLQEGKRADIVVFDEQTIIDNSTYMNPQQAPSGIEYVIFKGEVVVEGTEYNHKKLGNVVFAR